MMKNTLNIFQKIKLFVALPFRVLGLLYIMFAVNVLKPIYKKGTLWLSKLYSRWYKFRKLKYYHLVHYTFNIPEASKLPWWCIWIRFIYMPVETLQHLIILNFMKKKNMGGYDMMYDVWIIEGKRYSGEFFRGLSFALDGSKFEIVKIKDADDYITIKKID